MSSTTDPLPEADPLRRFLSGKRAAERRTCNLAVEVRGSGTSFAGRAVDVSEGGVMIWLDDKAIAAIRPGMSMLEALGLVERYFQNGAQVVFPTESLRVPSTVVRLTPPKDGTGIYLGCRFERALTPDEAAKLLEMRVEAPLVPLPLTPKKGTEGYLLVFQGVSAEAGPRYVAKIIGIGGAEIEARIEPTRPTPADEVRGELATDSLLARAVFGGKTVWEGTVTVVAVRPGISRTPVIDVRLSAGGAFPAAMTKRFERRPG